MHQDILPPSPFTAGTTYTGKEKFIDSPDVQRAPSQAIRPVGEAALHNSVVPPRIWRKEEHLTPEEVRRQYLEGVFRFPDPDSKDKYGRSLSERTSVTPESEMDAVYALRFANQDIKDLVRSYKDSEYWREEDTPRLLRDNNELRMSLGTLILEKFEGLYTLPERVHQNSPDNMKSPNHAGYPDKMLSRDYAAVIALSMLDGTYKERPDTGETTQHRTAAEMVLGIREQMEYARLFYRQHGIPMNKK
jgi:hypothetical protein